MKRLKNALRAGNVERYHSVPEVQSQKISEHCWNVSMIFCYIFETEIDNPTYGKALTHLLTHDNLELFTGDVPSTTKKASKELEEALEKLEKIFIEDVLVSTNEDYYLIQKLFDSLEGVFYTRHKSSEVKDNWVNYFRKNFERLTDIILYKDTSLSYIESSMFTSTTLKKLLNVVDQLGIVLPQSTRYKYEACLRTLKTLKQEDDVNTSEPTSSYVNQD